MSWFSEFVHDPIEFVQDEPLKALALVGGPIAAVAAPWAIPEIAGAAGLFGAGEAAAGAGAGLFGAGEGLSGLVGGATEGLGGLVSGAGDLFAGTAGSLGDALGFSAGEGAIGEAAGLGNASNAIADAGAQSFIDNPVAFGADTGLGPDLSSYTWEGPGGLGERFSGMPDFSNGPTNFGPSQATMDSVGGTVPMAPQASAGGGDLSAMAMDPSGISGAGKGAGDASTGLGGFWDSTKAYAMAHPFQTAGVGIAGLGLANNLLQGQRTSPEMAAMGANAAAMNKQSQMMMNYLQTGKLPPGLQASITQATQAMKAKIIANHARNGMPTDPSQNSALAQELNGVDMYAYSELAKTGIQLLNSGVQMAGISNQLYAQLEALNRQQSKETGIAIANFAAALNGGGTMRRAA